MAVTASREAYLETGLDVLASEGYGALKQSEVCRRMGVTTGSFYHFFKNWGDYTEQLLNHWFDSRTKADVANLRAQTDLDKRIASLLEYGLALPHRAEYAIRTWGSIDPEVRRVVEAVDRQRYDLVFEVVSDLIDPVAAHRYASWALYLLTGYEQATLAPDIETLEWAANRFVDSLKLDTNAAQDSRPAPARRRKS